MAGQLYVLSGPSGTGKSVIIRELRKEVAGLDYCVSHTTRKPRNNETNGADYHFVDMETFKAMIQRGDFIEWAQVYDDYYGTSVSELEGKIEQGHDVIMDIDVQGARNIRKRYRQSTLIYVLPPSMETLEKRLKERATDPQEVIKRRIEKALSEIGNCRWYDYIVFNEDLDAAVEEAKSIIVSKRCRTPSRLSMVEKRLGVKLTRNNFPGSK